MAQRKPESKVTLAQVIEMVELLTPDDKDRLLSKLKLEDLRRAIQVGYDQAERGELLSEEEVMQRLDVKRQEIMEKKKQ